MTISLLQPPILMIFFMIMGTFCVGYSSHTNAISYWKTTLKNMAMPNSVRDLVSPLSELETRIFETLFTSSELGDDRSFANALCSSGGLLCRNLNEYNELPVALMRAVFTDCISAGCFSSITKNVVANREMISNAKLLWFKEKDLLFEVGTVNAYRTLGNILISNKAALFQRSFLPRSLSNLLGDISESNLSNILKRLHIHENSIMATGMHSTIKLVQQDTRPLLPGEMRSAIKSVEDLADFLNNLMSKSSLKLTSFETLTTSTPFPKDNDSLYEGFFKATKVELKSDVNSPYMSCHSPIFPYRLEICHNVPQTRVYQVTLESNLHKRSTIQTAAICHTNTSNWDRNHIAFHVLDTKLGGEPLCHWVEPDGFTFVGN